VFKRLPDSLASCDISTVDFKLIRAKAIILLHKKRRKEISQFLGGYM